MKKYQTVPHSHCEGSWSVFEGQQSVTLHAMRITTKQFKIKSFQLDNENELIIKKLDSLKDEPGVVYGTRKEAKEHIRKLMNS